MWKNIGDNTYRMKVIGGWVVRFEKVTMGSISSSMAFVPDPDHSWE